MRCRSKTLTELRLWIFSCFNSWPSICQELARLLFQVAARLHDLTVEHQVAYLPPAAEGGAAPEPYVPPSPEEKNDMYAGADPTMSACRNGIISVITARCAKDKCASKAEKAASKHSELQATASALLADDNLKELGVVESKRGAIRKGLVHELLYAQDTVLV